MKADYYNLDVQMLGLMKKHRNIYFCGSTLGKLFKPSANYEDTLF